MTCSPQSLSAPVSGACEIAGWVISSDTSDVIATSVDPYFAEQQARYPVVSDQNDGAWALGVNGNGKLVVVHVSGDVGDRGADRPRAIAREIKVGPD